MNLPAKSAPSGYRLATHKYMLAKCKGLIQGPAIRTRVVKITKTKIEPTSSIDSEATEEYVEPPVVKKRKGKQKRRQSQAERAP